MINLTERLDKAIRIAASAHEHARQHRKGGDVPYIIHPFGVMLIASNVTSDEDILIACLLHDILEDVPARIYGVDDMRADFGDNVVHIVQDVTKDSSIKRWRPQCEAYLDHLARQACDEAIIVSASDKIHNLQATLIDYKVHGDALWQRFSTKNAADQLWWYESILAVVRERSAPELLVHQLDSQVQQLRRIA